jgi:hypothetical protein
MRRDEVTEDRGLSGRPTDHRSPWHTRLRVAVAEDAHAIAAMHTRAWSQAFDQSISRGHPVSARLDRQLTGSVDRAEPARRRPCRIDRSRSTSIGA